MAFETDIMSDLHHIRYAFVFFCGMNDHYNIQVGEILGGHVTEVTIPFKLADYLYNVVTRIIMRSELRTNIIKFTLLCLVCVGIVTAIVLLIQFLKK